MNEDELDLSWAKSQLANARVHVSVGVAVLQLLEAWAELQFPSEEVRDKALEIFSKLAKDEALYEESEAVYRPVQVGFDIQVGNTVRVREDAFPGPSGRTHNGRVGRVLAKRNGDIIVRSTDGKEPYLDMAHYPPSALELRVN